MTPQKLNNIGTVNPGEPDDFLILSSSWEERCLGFAQKTKNYYSKNILLNVYDSKNTKKEEHIKLLTELLESKGSVKNFTNRQSNPIDGIKHMLHFMKDAYKGAMPRISFDISCFTRKHLLQLLNCLDCNKMLNNTNFYYTQPIDYYDENNNSNAEGIDKINEIETYSGENFSSRDTALLLFLNFEGKRAISLWNELQPHRTVPIVPYPSMKKEWEKKVQNNNKLLLSTLNLSWDEIEKADAINPEDTKNLLIKLTQSNQYNYIIGPLGTKAQVLGIFKFWRLFPNAVSIVYPSPIKYKDVPYIYAPEHVWLIDRSSDW